MEIGFITIDSSSGEVRLTGEGANFALEANTIIDMHIEDDNFQKFIEDYGHQPLTGSERTFLLKHINTNLPGEWKLMEQIANLIHQGFNRPKALDEKLMEMNNWDMTMASQMRNGIMGRMQELSLISREKEGREVTYHFTSDEEGKKILVDKREFAGRKDWSE
jgi:hypothetical protein